MTRIVFTGANLFETAHKLGRNTKLLGVPGLDVVRWATKNGAEAMGLGEESGTVEAGKLADLVVVNGDPTADISCLKEASNPLAILKDGAFVKDALGWSVGPASRRYSTISKPSKRG